VVPSRTGGFAFLSFSFRWQKSQKGKPYFRTEPSPAAEQALRDAVRELAPSYKTWRDPQEVVREINQVTRGWGNYFALAHYHRSFGQMNSFIAHRLRQWLWRKHGNPLGKYKYWTPEVLQATYGLQLLPTCWSQ
jgi:RNA-directed DNA polymerase